MNEMTNFQPMATPNVYMSNEAYNNMLNMSYQYGRTVGYRAGYDKAITYANKQIRKVRGAQMVLLLTPVVIYSVKTLYSLHKKKKFIKAINEEATNGQKSNNS